MKQLVVLLLFVASCDVQSAVPANARRCSSDAECEVGEFCGYAGVDSPYVCRQLMYGRFGRPR